MTLTPKQLATLEAEIVQGLTVPDHDRCWVAVNKALDFQVFHVELDAVVAPTLTSEQRHYNSGRMAALLDFQEFLAAKFAEAREQAAKKG